MAVDRLIDGGTDLLDGRQHQPVVAAVVGRGGRRRGRQLGRHLANPHGPAGQQVVACNQATVGALEQGASDLGLARAQWRDEPHGGKAQRPARCHDCSTD